MSYGWPPRPPATVPWLRAIRELFTDDKTPTSEGVGANLVQILAELIRAVDRCTAEIKRFNDWTDRQQ
jgi:hypothetical protein